MADLKILRQFILPFGLYAGLVRIIIDYIPKRLWIDPEIYYFSFIIAFALELAYIPYVIIKYKQTFTDVTRKDCIRIGLLLMLIVGLFYNVGDVLHMFFIDPDFKLNTMKNFMEMYSPELLPIIEKEMQERPPEVSMTNVMSSLATFLFTGVVISFISSFFILRKIDERQS